MECELRTMLPSPKLELKFLALCLGRKLYKFKLLKFTFILCSGFSVEEIEEVMAAGRREEPQLQLPQDSAASKQRSS